MEFEKKIQDTIWGTVVHASDILISTKNQRFKVVINQVVWFAVHVFVETDPRVSDTKKYRAGVCGPHNPTQAKLQVQWYSITWDKVSEHITLDGAKEKYNQVIEAFRFSGDRRSDMPALLQSLAGSFKDIHFLAVINGQDAKDNPDKYFLPGDHVQVQRFGYNHAAIYIGNRRVIQVPDTSCGVKEDDWESFHHGDTGISIVFCKIRNRTGDEVVQAAKSKIGRYKGEYNVLWKNCQHFATSCQFGDEFGFCLEIPV